MIGAYLVDDVTLVQHAARDSWGEQGATTETAQNARIDRSTKLVRDNNGEEVISSARVMMVYQVLTHEDTLTYDGVSHSIIRIDVKKDFAARFIEVAVI